MSLSFQNPNNKLKGQELKDALVQIIRDDKDQERLISGFYWSESDQKGCAIGCSEHALCTVLGHEFKDDRHEYLSGTLNIPESLFYLEDATFEGLHKEDANKFVVDFVEALPVGKDLRNVEYEVKIWILGRTKQYANDATKVIINEIIELHRKKIDGEDVDYSTVLREAQVVVDSTACSAARSAAYSAAYSAWSAVRSAVWSAESAEQSIRRAVCSGSAASTEVPMFWHNLSQFLIKKLQEKN